MKKQRIGILTGGGDCPGINAVIRAVTKTAIHHFRMEVVGFLDGFRGLVDDETVPLTFNAVSNILTQGGTILGTSSRENYFGISLGGQKPASKDRLKDAQRIFRKHRLKGLICIGGDGTLTVAHHLHRHGIPVIGVPKTIDNDVRHTDLTFGFDSARAIATEAVDRLHSTAASHHRVMVIEVMGRHAGWLALHAGMAGGGDVLLIPEIPFSIQEVCRVVLERSKRGRRFSLVVAAEGAERYRPQPGGIGVELAQRIEQRTGLESRATILGHLQRGGSPTAFDRILATQFGYEAAVMAAEKERFGRMICLRNGKMESVGLNQVAGRSRNVPLNSPLIAAARAIGVSFGA